MVLGRARVTVGLVGTTPSGTVVGDGVGPDGSDGGIGVSVGGFDAGGDPRTDGCRSRAM